MLVVLVGGARSGKTSLALRLLGDRASTTYIATAPRIDGDDDFDRRIDCHRAERPDGWRTIEEQLDLVGALDRAGDDPAIVDCLTLWTTNHLMGDAADDDIVALAAAAARVAATRTAPTVVVTNEVGSGVHPTSALGRRFQDLLGRVNQQWVDLADHAYLVVAGRALELVTPDLVDLDVVPAAPAREPRPASDRPAPPSDDRRPHETAQR